MHPSATISIPNPNTIIVILTKTIVTTITSSITNTLCSYVVSYNSKRIRHGGGDCPQGTWIKLLACNLSPYGMLWGKCAG